MSRDDLSIEPGGRRPSTGQRTSYYSRLELAIRPMSEYFVLELVGKGTIRNKKFSIAPTYQRLADVDQDSFVGLIDQWVLDYAELYAAKS